MKESKCKLFMFLLLKSIDKLIFNSLLTSCYNTKVYSREFLLFLYVLCEMDFSQKNLDVFVYHHGISKDIWCHCSCLRDLPEPK